MYWSTLSWSIFFWASKSDNIFYIYKIKSVYIFTYNIFSYFFLKRISHELNDGSHELNYIFCIVRRLGISTRPYIWIIFRENKDLVRVDYFFGAEKSQIRQNKSDVFFLFAWFFVQHHNNNSHFGMGCADRTYRTRIQNESCKRRTKFHLPEGQGLLNDSIFLRFCRNS